MKKSAIFGKVVKKKFKKSSEYLHRGSKFVNVTHEEKTILCTLTLLKGMFFFFCFVLLDGSHFGPFRPLQGYGILGRREEGH